MKEGRNEERKEGRKKGRNKGRNEVMEAQEIKKDRNEGIKEESQGNKEGQE